MYFVISDIHGCWKEFNEVLSYWNQKDRLIILGDLIDRGPDSLACLKLSMELVKNKNAIVLGGNHEEVFLEWLEIEGEDPKLIGFYYLEVFNETVHSFFPKIPKVFQVYNKAKIAEEIKKNYPDIVQFLRERPAYFETDHLIFVHAGCSGKENWRETAEQDCKYIRNPFIFGENYTGKTIIFGHTPTQKITGTENNDIWISPCRTKIGIDGACAYGGQMNAVRVSEEGRVLETYTVKGIKKNSNLNFLE